MEHKKERQQAERLAAFCAAPDFPSVSPHMKKEDIK